MAGLATGLFEKFLEYLYKTGEISIPSDFHGQVSAVNIMLGNDITGVISTITDYAINSASEAQFKIESSDQTLEDLLSLWLENINVNIDGVPTGIKELALEYYKERWAGSSLCLMRLSQWKKISIGNNSITVPTVLWFVNGGSVFIKRTNEKNFKLGSDAYYLDEAMKISVPAKKEEKIIIQKPYSRWYTKYPTSYLIKKGVYKNFRGLEVLSEKSDEVISKVLPYLFMIEKGDKDVFLQKDVDYTNDELKTLVDSFKTALEKYKGYKGDIPVNAVPFDQKYSHLIPDLKGMLSEELYRQGYRAILAGLGFVGVMQGVGNTREQEVINPKPFVAEVNAGVDGFKSMLMDVIRLIIVENKYDHKKLFSDKNYLKVVNTPLNINTSLILDDIRSAYIYGTISVQTYQEVLGIDPDQELERMKKEWSDGLREIYYPHLIQNSEDKGVDAVIPTTKKQIEKNTEKEKKPTTMNKAEKVLEEAPYKNLDELPEYIKKMTVKCQETFMATFNSVYEETGNEAKSLSIANSAAQRCMKKQGYVYDKESKTWKKK